MAERTEADRIRSLIERAKAGDEVAALLDHPAVQRVKANLIAGTVDAILKTDDAAERERLVIRHRFMVAFFNAVDALAMGGAMAARALREEAEAEENS